MADYWWPKAGEQRVLGQRLSRLDGPIKSTGRAQYSSDKKPKGMLYGKLLTCPHAHARIRELDTSSARSMPGVKAVLVIQDVGSEVQWALDEIVAVAAITEDLARDAIRAIRIEYEVLSHFVTEEDLAGAPETKDPQEESAGDPDAAFAQAHAVVENTLGLPQIAHMCLEPHGQVALWQGDECVVYASTQAVSTLPVQLAQPLGVPASKIRIRTDYMGGGFGSKFSPDRWGVVGAKLAQQAGAPVKLFLERDQEVAVAGSRPSAYAAMRAGATKDGRLTAWESESWGSGGRPGTGATPLPYVFEIPNRRKKHTPVRTHFAGARAWRAPNHPQACFLTMSMLEDLAHALRLDPLDLFKKNLDLTLGDGRYADVYSRQLDIAAEKIGWRQHWTPRDERSPGPVQRGLGLSLHTWGGRGHRSTCEVIVQSDGSVEARLGTQDLGTGTRTVVAMVLAETFGLGIDQVVVTMGDSKLPQSGPSGGSTTVGGVSGSTRKGAQDALRQVLGKVAPELGVEPDQLEAVGGRVQVVGDSSRGLAWREAAALIGMTPVTATGRNTGLPPLNDSGVAGVQMADVSVDTETGVVRVNRMVAVQDCGLIVNHKLAESQMYGGMIMGISTALFEEWIPDPVTGRLLNADMEFYKLASFSDVGVLDVHLMTDEEFHDRGVIGLGEPPVISPAAALANAVTNAIGARIQRLPMTPDRVLQALDLENAKSDGEGLA